MPTKVWAVGEEVLAADFNTYVQQQVVSQFANLSALQAGWPNAPIGARAIVTDTFMTYTHRAAGGTGWSPDWASGLIAVAFTTGAGTITHPLGRAPTAVSLLVGQSVAAFVGCAGLTATQINCRAWTSAGVAYAGNLNLFWYVA